MSYNLNNKTALITGGSKGIGKDIVKKFINSNCNVAFTYLSSDEEAEKIEKEFGRNNLKIKKYKSDASNFEASSKLVEDVIKDFGGFDILINNAGITRDAPLHKMSKDNWQKVIDVNLNSIFNMTSLVINKMRENNFGRIVHISSVNGQKGQFGQTNYAATKSALIGFSKSLALESASKGITSNVVCPGYINTEMVAAIREDILKSIIETIPNKRLGEADEVAEMVDYLVSDKASYINGSTFSINGGLWMD